MNKLKLILLTAGITSAGMFGGETILDTKIETDMAVLQEEAILKDEAIAVKDIQISDLTKRVDEVKFINAKTIVDEKGVEVDLGLQSADPIIYQSNGQTCTCSPIN